MEKKDSHSVNSYDSIILKDVATDFVQSQFAHYKVVQSLGQGAMGKVYKALDMKLNRMVAIKVLLGQQNQNQNDVHQRFQNEALSMSKIQHRNIAQIYEVGTQDNTAFFAMEYIDGGDLKNYARKKKLSLVKIAKLVAQIAEGISCAHQNNIIHRDLKPQNILVEGSTPKIIDFGLAKVKNVETGVTRSGSIVGTLEYMSPEQVRGEKLDERADIYSLGAILYELLTGRVPFKASSSVNLIFQITRNNPQPPSQIKRKIPQDLENICLKALEKKSPNRYKTAKEFAKDLSSFAKGEPPKFLAGYSSVHTKRWRLYKYLALIPLLFLPLLFLGKNRPSISTAQKSTNWRQKTIKQLQQLNLQHSKIYKHKGHDYVFINTPASWTKAQKICEALGGYLLTITDSEENNFITSIMPKKKDYWIGLQRKESYLHFRWVSGEVLRYANWSILQKKAHTINRDKMWVTFMRIESDNFSAWRYQHDASHKKLFICEWGKKRIPQQGTGRTIVSHFRIKHQDIITNNIKPSRNMKSNGKHAVVSAAGDFLTFHFDNTQQNATTKVMIRSYAGVINKRISRTFVDIFFNKKILQAKKKIIHANPYPEYFDISNVIKKGKNTLKIGLHRKSRTIYFLEEVVVYTVPTVKETQRKGMKR